MGIPNDLATLLDDAHASLIDAGNEPNDSVRRRCFAHHAATQAADVLVRLESTAAQRVQASSYLQRAIAWQAPAASAGLTPTREYTND
jgi:hypothetical protein